MNLTRQIARELIAFYLDAGVDCAVQERPVDRFADEPRTLADRAEPDGEDVRATPASDPARGDSSMDRLRGVGSPVSAEGQTTRSAPPPPVAPEAAITAARESAGSAKDLEKLRALLAGFTGCTLAATATQLVFADGNPRARVMFVGEAPGRDEDIAGVPFVGRSGKLLDLMLAAIELDRTKAYIANVVPWRPPGNRTPTPQETAICLPFIRRQIELANPDILVCLGQPATQTLLATREGITKTRGRWFKYDSGSREIRALATYHPAFLLRSPLQKRFAWRDFLALKKALAQ
jgi:uracil-DNA glycosylase